MVSFVCVDFICLKIWTSVGHNLILIDRECSEYCEAGSFYRKLAGKRKSRTFLVFISYKTHIVYDQTLLGPVQNTPPPPSPCGGSIISAAGWPKISRAAAPLGEEGYCIVYQPSCERMKVEASS
jgi:hypothetical protein